MRVLTRVGLGWGLALFACDSGGSDEGAPADEQTPAARAEPTESKAPGDDPEPVAAAPAEAKAAPAEPKPGVEPDEPEPEPEQATPSEDEEDDEDDETPSVGTALGSAMAGAMKGTAAGGPFMKSGEDKLVSARQSLFVRADGSGEAVTGMHLRDPGLVAKRLGLVVVPGRFGTNMAVRKGGKATMRLSTGNATRVEVVSKHVTTPAGVAVGMRYDDIVAKVPGTLCTAEPGEGGEFLHCQVDVGVHAIIEAPKGLGDDWDSNVMKPGKAKKLAGKAKVSALEAWYTEVPEPSTETEVVVSLVDETGVLPAGVSWNGDTYPVCETVPGPKRCHRPRAAVVAGVFDSAEATKQLAAVDREGLAPGYPLVVHTDELELEDTGRDGVAIVLAQFARPDAAETWHATRPGSEVLAVAAKPNHDDQRTRVARLRPGSVTAYAGQDLGQIDHGVDPGKAVCEVPGDTLALFEFKDGVVYESLPVSCPDGTKAYVRWWDTMVFTTVGEDPKGKATVWQLVGAECDQPRFARWRWNEGARAGQPKIVEGDAC